MSINYVSKDLRFDHSFRSGDQGRLHSSEGLGGLAHHHLVGGQAGADVGGAEVGHGRVDLLGEGRRSLLLVSLCWRLGDDWSDGGGRNGVRHLVERLDRHLGHGDQHGVRGGGRGDGGHGDRLGG